MSLKKMSVVYYIKSSAVVCMPVKFKTSHKSRAGTF